MTGIVTASMIDLIISGSLCRTHLSTWEQAVEARDPAPFEKPHRRGGYLPVHVPVP